MTKDEIIEMLEAEWRDRLKAAVLDEREACATICEQLPLPDWPNNIRQPLAQAIRARGHEK
jgi:hypothetical protein